MIAQIDSEYVKNRPWKLWSRMISYALFEGRPLTTRGRWINPLVLAHQELEKHLPQIKKVEKPVFILGTGRSGTTILGVVMSMHRQVGFLNEPKALWYSIHKGEDVIGNYTRRPARYRLGEADATEEVKRNAHRLFGAYLAATFSGRVVDKYPEIIFRVPFVKAIFPDARFIFLVRNGWDTCLSIKKWSERLGGQVGGERHDWWGANNRKWKLLLEEVISRDPAFDGLIEEVRGFDRHLDMAAVEWIVTMREGLEVMKKESGSVQMVRFEDLTGRPVETLESVLEFCELPPDRKFMDYAVGTLSEVPPKGELDINPAIVPLFRETMSALGYESGPAET